jgi:hypothetical protein
MTIDADTLRQMIAEDELGLLELPVKPKVVTAEDRLIASFKEITDFVREHGREPAANAADMGEMKLFFRLDAMAKNDDQREALEEHDELGILKELEPPASLEEALASDSEGLLDDPAGGIYTMNNVPKPSNVPETIAQREKCEDFPDFEPLFKACHAELRAGTRRLVAFRNEQQIRPDTFYVLKGVLTYVAAEGERRKEHGRINTRLRCIFENGTEANLLLRSLSSQLYRFGKRVTEPNAQTLEAMGLDPDAPRGAVYVLRSLSDDPQVIEIPHLHKIGFTTGTTSERTSRAKKDETFLGAPVEVIAEYEVPAGIARKVEQLLHRFFSDARLDAWFEREGVTGAEAREWFSVPIDVIDQAIKLIEAESIQSYEYDREERTIRLQS